MKRSAGFTLIELIIVIVILGILAVTAAPKFMNMQGDARKSVLNGMSASIKTAANLVYSKAIIAGVEKQAGVDLAIQGVTGDSTAIAFGYPTAADTGILEVLDANTTATGTGTTTTGANAEWGRGVNGSNYIMWPTGVATTAAAAITAACYIQYTPATSATVPPVYTVVATGC